LALARELARAAHGFSRADLRPFTRATPAADGRWIGRERPASGFGMTSMQDGPSGSPRR